MYPKKDTLLLLRTWSFRPYVQSQAIFTLRVVPPPCEATNDTIELRGLIWVLDGRSFKSILWAVTLYVSEDRIATNDIAHTVTISKVNVSHCKVLCDSPD